MKVNTAGLFSLAHRAPTQELEVGAGVEIIEDGGPPAPPRTRKTTLEHFNEEMSVLDRPLEAEVEFYDEPKPRRWRVPAIGGAIFLVSCAAYLGVLRHRNAVAAAAVSAPPVVASAPPPVAAMPVVEAAPAAAAPATPAPVEAPSAPSAASAAAPVVADASAGGTHHHHHSHHASASSGTSGSARHHHHHGHHGRA